MVPRCPSLSNSVPSHAETTNRARLHFSILPFRAWDGLCAECVQLVPLVPYYTDVERL